MATGAPAARLEAAWIGAAPTRAVMAALGGAAFFVGGCVRNGLLGEPVKDIDLATPLTPATVTERLEAAGLRAVPTGLDHGTVTAVAAGRPFEITTFRADVETFGRHAVVRFTTDMAEDAARRDFTLNALYADAQGRVHDPLGGGLADLRARRVRFIGRAADRIREDYLRILRFFRFLAWYGHGAPDAEGLDACTRLAAGMEGLARERVGHEMRRLLDAPDPAAAVAAMARAGILARVLPGAEAAALPALVRLEQAGGLAPDWPRRLAALGAPDAAAALKLSRAEAKAQDLLARLAASGHGPARLAQEAGADPARDALLLRAARGGEPLPAGMEAELARGAAAVFPLRAADLMAAGFRPGPALGRALARAEMRWRESGFALDKAALLAECGQDSQQG